MKNLRLEWKETEEGLRIKIPKPDTWLVKLISRRCKTPLYKEVILDELGSWVFLACDGERTVKKIINSFAVKHNLNPKEAAVSIVEYLRQLARRGLIGFGIVKGSVK